MAEKIATRAAYGEALVALAEEYPELVVLDADLSGSTMTKGFAKAHPDRFYNMGIAEANMTGVAAGLAACGKKPFTNTFAMFAAGRAWEQVRNSIAYPCWTMTAPPICGWAAWRWRVSPTLSPATPSTWARASPCGTAPT
mgnify:CR=1 FL=1